MRYTHPNYDVAVHTNGHSSGLERLGFKSDSTIAIEEKRLANRERLNALRAQKAAEKVSRERQIWEKEV